MTRLAVLGLLLISISNAQSISKASSGDGAILHFASKLALRGEPFALNPGRIFRHADPPILQVIDVQNRSIAGPFVSGDGLTTAAFTYSPCLGPCLFARPTDVLNLKRAGKDYVFYGNNFRVSRNGRFVFDAGVAGFHPGANIRDIDTGIVYNLPNVLPRHASQAISDEGTLLSTGPVALAEVFIPEHLNQVLLTPFGKAPEILYAGLLVKSAAITAQGNSVFLLSEIKPGKLIFRSFFRLIKIDLATRWQSVLFEGFAELSGFTVNADGGRLLLHSGNDLLLWDRSSGWRSLFSHDEGFTESLLTDNGEIVFAKTGTNRMYRIDANTGEAQQLYAPFPSSLWQQNEGA